ncbi:MAG: dihydropteroate synthase [bacterium]
MSEPRGFQIVGENIHCTRVFKVGGAFARQLPDGRGVIVYGDKESLRELPVPPVYRDGVEWAGGKVKHCAVAIWQGLHGDSAGRAAGEDYLRFMAKRQTAAGAAYLDLNVDEFSTDADEKHRAVIRVAEIMQSSSSLPLSIDSSQTTVLRAGLAACDRARAKPMVNSVSLERPEAIAIAAEFGAVVIASAASEHDLPHTTEERLANVARLMAKLEAAGLRGGAIYVDPLVFPVATDVQNPVSFLNAVRALRTTYGEGIHITGGLSNVSFGMPCRKIVNQVFTWLALEAGADSAIVDPTQINDRVLAALDTRSEPFRLAHGLLTGADEFGAEFIAAHRDGRLVGE